MLDLIKNNMWLKWPLFPFVMVYLIIVGGFLLPFSVGNMGKNIYTVIPKMSLWILSWGWGFVWFAFGLATKSVTVQQYAFGLDQSLNALIGGSRDLTLSSALGDKIVSGKAKLFEIHFCNTLSLYDDTYTHHCVEARGN